MGCCFANVQNLLHLTKEENMDTWSSSFFTIDENFKENNVISTFSNQ